MNDAKKIAEILKKNCGYVRIMEQLKNKFYSYGESRGKISLKDATQEECYAVDEIICPKIGYEPPTLSFTVKDFENGLSQYGKVSLREVLESYFSITLQTRTEHESEKAEKKNEFENELLSRYGGKPCYSWLVEMFASGKYGYKIVMEQYNNDPKAAKSLVSYVCNAVDSRYEQEFEPIGLPILAAEITSNPHYFDIKSTAGNLLVNALGFLSNKSQNNSEEIKEIYFYFGIEADSITSACALLGIRLYDKKGEEHKAYKMFADKGEIAMLSVANLVGISSADCDRKKVFAVENPAVFIALVPIVIKKGFAMICTSGQLKRCVLKTLDMLSDSGCTIYYAGDFDPEGLLIADKILSRYKTAVHIWRMSKEDYYSIKRVTPLSESRLKKLDSLKVTKLKELGDAIKSEKKAAYQELMIPDMIEDVGLVY